MPDSGLDQIAAIRPEDLDRFRTAFANRNETLITAGDPAASEETRALKLAACRPDQRPHAAAVHAFAQRIGEIGALIPSATDETAPAATPALDTFLDEIRPLFRAARAVADMPEDGGVAAALAALMEQSPAGSGAAPPVAAPPMIDDAAIARAAHQLGGSRRYHALMRAARDCLLPLERGFPCAKGWRFRPPRAEIRPYFLAAGMPTPRTGRAPMGVTWHRAGGAGLDSVRRRFASQTAGESRSSTHYCIGADAAEGVERYVSIEDRAWHAGKRQTLRWDGRACALRTRRGHQWINRDWSAARTTIGVTVVGFPEPITHSEHGDIWEGVPHGEIDYATMPNGQGRRVLRFSDDQYDMMIAVGREIVERWPHIRPWSHHGHYDICPDYRWDPLGLDFARVLRGIYVEETVPDVWTPLRTAAQRQRVMKRLCALLDIKRSVVVDGIWGIASRTTLRSIQRVLEERKARRRPGVIGRWRAALITPEIEDLEARPIPAHTAVNGFWTSFTNWDVHAVLAEHELDLAEAAGPAAADPPEEGPDESDRRRKR